VIIERLRILPLALVALLGCKKEPAPAPPPAPVTAKAPAPPAKTEPAPAVKSELTGEPLVWRVSKGDDSLVIMGTLHTGGASFIPQVAWDELAKAKRFAMECDLSKIDQLELARRMHLPEGQTLDKMISPAAWATLVKEGSLPEMALKNLKPWVAAMGILQAWLSGAQAVDLALKARADELHLAAAYLESWQDQFNMIDKALDARALEVFLADLPKAHQMLDELVAAYKAGNVDKIVELTLDDPMMTPEARELMLTGRNRKWVPQLVELARGHDTFVAVGAGHVVGKDGLLDMLEHQGYEVERLKNPPPGP
jgi:uncharacterized protein YbaP (TraB family)